MKSVGPGADSLLSCSRLCKSFGGVRALVDVSIKFDSNSVTSVVGPNGAGKTTLLDVLSGFVRPDKGNCFIGPTSISTLSPYLIARLGIARTFQEVRLIREMSVLENVLLAGSRELTESILGAVFRPLNVNDENRQDSAMSVLKLCGLETIARNRAGSISYGQQKLLTLACAIGSCAQTLLLDEPMSGVHPELSSQIADLLIRYRDEGKSLIVVEHDISFVRNVSDRVIVMAAGAVIAEGGPADIFSRPNVLEAYLGH